MLAKKAEGKSDLVPSRLLVNDFLQKWLDDYVEPNLGGRTLRSYTSLLRNHVIPAIGDRQLATLKPLDVQAIYSRMYKKGLSGTTALHCHRVLREALSHAYKWGLVDVNVADRVTAPRSTTGEARAASTTELNKILDVADPTVIGPLVRLTIWTGMRLSEVLGLRWSDIDIEHARLHVRQTYGNDGVFRQPKTKSSRRIVPLSKAIVRFLSAYRQAQDEYREEVGQAYDASLDLVFTDPLGRPMTQHQVNYRWRRITKEAGLPGLRFHDLRHSHASHLFAAGVPLHEIQARLGHSVPSTTMNVYGHLLPGIADTASNVMDVALPGK
jgi:integrase